MGTESTAPPSVTDEKSSNPVSEFVKPVDGGGQDAKDVADENLGKSVFVNSEPMREEQVQNAIKFLSHPKVKGSPVIYRRSFLEKKGLTKEEIDEAFRRVPDSPPSNVTSAPPTVSSQGIQLPSSTNLQSQVPAPVPQPPVGPTNGRPTVATLQQSRFHWTHAFLAVGLLAASGAGTAVLVKNTVVPRLKKWIRKVVSEEDDSEKGPQKPSPAEEAVAAAKAAAMAAADVAKASQEMLLAKNEERKYFEAFKNLLDHQVEEMKSMGNTLRKLETPREFNQSSDRMIEEQVRYASGNGPTNKSWRNIPLVDQGDPKLSPIVSKQTTANGEQDINLGSVRPSSAPAYMEPAVAPNPKSYTEIMSMLQRGEKPPGIKDIDDKPPNPNQPPSNPRLIPRSKPWEASQVHTSSIYGTQPQVGGDLSNPEIHTNGSSSLSNGKPGSSTTGDNPEWWRRKTVKITEIERETNDAAMDAPPAARAWVPPKPPTVVIPEAAAAIRKPKPVIQTEQSVHDINEIQKSSTADDDLRADGESTNGVLEGKSSNGDLEGNAGDGEREQLGVSEEIQY